MLIPKILKGLLLGSLLVFFYVYFFKKVYKDFQNKMTSIAYSEEFIEKDGIQAPVVTVCLPLKPSVLQKYGIKSSFFGYRPDISIIPKNITLTNLYIEASIETSPYVWENSKKALRTSFY